MSKFIDFIGCGTDSVVIRRTMMDNVAVFLSGSLKLDAEREGTGVAVSKKSMLRRFKKKGIDTYSVPFIGRKVLQSFGLCIRVCQDFDDCVVLFFE